jgi:hypothetical protein
LKLLFSLKKISKLKIFLKNIYSNFFLEKTNKMVENYDKRINQFILNMATKPIKIKDYMHPIENVRFELMKETENKIQGRKGFIFKGFVTEKERIEQYLAEKNKYLELEQKINEKSSKNNSPKKKASSNYASKYTYVQPQMRFKPRTELERIFDAINEYSYGRVSKDLINKQLRKLDLNNVKKFKNSSMNDEDDEENEKLFNNTLRDKRRQQIAESHLEKLIKENDRHEMDEGDLANYSHDDNSGNGSSLFRDRFKSKRKLVDNSAAKNLMKEYHYKTHFKAATAVASKRKLDKSNNENKSHNLTTGSNEHLDTQTSKDHSPGVMYKTANNFRSRFNNTNGFIKTQNGFNKTGQSQKNVNNNLKIKSTVKNETSENFNKTHTGN